MKKVKVLAVILMLGIIAVSCKKEEGPQGPAGPAGTNGTNGTNGNANVMVYGFGETVFSITTTSSLFPLPISSGLVDSSLILPYYKTGLTGLWYMAGEVGPDLSYLSRFYIFPGSTVQNLYIKIADPDGTSYSGADVTWDSIRVFVIPATIFKSTPMGKVDFADYYSVKSYYTER